MSSCFDNYNHLYTTTTNVIEKKKTKAITEKYTQTKQPVKNYETYILLYKRCDLPSCP